MKKCSDIENLLPLYAEGVLSDEEKRRVDEHLADCAQCLREMAYLQKAGELVNRLPQVEEPPWFQQKIMTRVREEAGKKSFAQKWFYPLRIKIPVQIMATLVIAVLAVYIYRSGDEQVKSILTSAPKPAVDVMKEQPSAPVPEATVSDLPAPAPRKKADAPKEVRKDKALTEVRAARGSVQKSDTPEGEAGADYKMDAVASKGAKENREEAYGALQAEQNKLQSAGKQMKDQERKARDQALPAMVKKSESYKMAVPAAPQIADEAAGGQQVAAKSFATMPVAAIPEVKLAISVDDPAAAAVEVEKILIRHNAKKLTRQTAEGKVIVQAEVSARDWKKILSELKAIRQVEEKELPAAVSGVIRVTMEMSKGS